MIYTVTLNPAVDYMMRVPELILGKTNRSEGDYYRIGGKGITVSMVLSNLEQHSKALGYLGGFTGIFCHDQIKQYPHIEDAFFEAPITTRVCLKIKGDIETEINGQGEVISQEKIEELETFLRVLTKDDIVVLSGSLAPGFPKDWYVQIAKKLDENNIQYVVDIATKRMLDIVEYHPLLVKPNEAELGDIFDTKITGVEDCIEKAKELVSMGAKHVIVSRGGSGSILATKDGVWEATVPKRKVIDTVGAGDSMVAGFIYGIEQFNDAEKALIYGSACGSATAFSIGLAEKKEVEELLSQITIVKR